GNCLAILKHDGVVNSVFFSPKKENSFNLQDLEDPKGYLVLTASSDKIARLWDMKGNEVVRFEGMNSSITLAKFFPNSEFVVAIADTTCIIYTSNGKIQTKLKGHTKNIYDLDISKNGSFIATSGYDNTAKIWDRNGKLVLNIDEHKRIVAIVRFSDDEKFVLTASDDLNINVWTLGGKKIANLTGHQSTIWSAGFSPNAKKIISASDDGTARLWNLDGQELMLFKGHTSQVMSASYSPDGKHVITASGDGTARIWNIHPKENPNLKGHKAVVRDVDISNDGKRIITAGFDYTAKLWSSNGKLLKTLTGFDAYGLDYVKFNSKSNMFAVGCNEQVKVYNDLGDSIVELRGHGGNITTAHFISENHAIITYSNDKNAFVWNLNGEKFQKIEKIEGLKVFGQGKELITINTDTSWSYWKMYFENDSIKFRKINTIRCHDASINSIDIHHEKNMVLTTSDDSTAIIWNLNSGNKIDKLISYSCRLKLGIFSPNGNKVCITTQDHIILLFSNISDRKPQIHHLRGHSDDITDVNFSNDGKHIVSASNDNTIKVWNLAGVNVMTLPNHKAAVMKAMFSPDDNFILSASQDHTARLTPWRVEDVLQKINVDKVRGEVWELGEKDKEVYGIE
ncbi:MAG: WD40 repeat domain-containing protein, partial [Bacteroidia bacterium]|nr:WD40 repeat domain-containing protein [Bacteroidia bacterium]